MLLMTPDDDDDVSDDAIDAPNMPLDIGSGNYRYVMKLFMVLVIACLRNDIHKHGCNSYNSQNYGSEDD